MAPPCFYSQVYIRIVEARGLTGTNSNGTSNPFVVIHVDGKKREHLETKRVEKTIAPQWHQEFVFTVSSGVSVIELNVFDWHLIRSNVHLGTARIQLHGEMENQFQDKWLQLDTYGELHVMIQEIPFKASPLGASEHMNVRLSPLRLQLENTVYFPGQVVRGALSYGLRKQKRVKAIRIEIDGRTYTEFTPDDDSYYYSFYVFFNATATMVGSSHSSTHHHKATLMGPGSFVFPFEYVLPMDIPPSFNDDTLWGNWNRYRVTGFVEFEDNTTETTNLTFRVLQSPMHAICTESMLSTSIKVDGAFTAPQNVICSVSGAAQVWSGELYNMHCKIQNYGQKSIEGLHVVLKRTVWCHGRFSGTSKWNRHLYEGRIRRANDEWHFVSLPGFPVAPGATWEGDITLGVPPGLTPSMHCTLSPIIQISYVLKVKLFTVGNVFTKASGTLEYPVLVADRSLWSTSMAAPLEPMGPLGKLISAPAPSNIYETLVPSLTIDGKSPVCAGRAFGEISTYPGAMEPAQVSRSAAAPEWTSRRMFLVSNDMWVRGTVPFWVNDDGLKPEGFDGTTNMEPMVMLSESASSSGM